MNFSSFADEVEKIAGVGRLIAPLVAGISLSGGGMMLAKSLAKKAPQVVKVNPIKQLDKKIRLAR